MTSGWKNTSTSSSKHGTSRQSVEAQNQKLLDGTTDQQRARFLVLFAQSCAKCGEVMWVHRTDGTGPICPTDERY